MKLDISGVDVLLGTIQTTTETCDISLAVPEGEVFMSVLETKLLIAALTVMIQRAEEKN